MTTHSHQGGKVFGQLKKQQENDLDSISAEFPEVEEALIQKYKEQFMAYDVNNSGDIDMMELKLMLERVGQTKTHLELKKMMAEVSSNGETITFRDFLVMMTGKKSSILQKILMFEEMTKKPETPKGPPPKKSITDFFNKIKKR
ncbi:calcium-binding protein [Cavenderia fasciculata]|uniref:Calcium-binding protein n=1 Tax=Cavenderia fasciculata TaxID=261658 RepID=F4PM35_CACFS|nr:calcium-binding protein [Cavenderia fasciculata]EGG22738.1 calcium-binding protein [Cavenderia fasciculata]|eukprot:XP_004360589.1 calcium-binding protein [Cavenderia fasciculata]